MSIIKDNISTPDDIFVKGYVTFIILTVGNIYIVYFIQ